jgi:predicted LPLAT superfamily acyltransferase
MHTGHFYQLLSSLARRMGSWVFSLGSWWVATGYFILFPRRVAVSGAFYRALFPGRGRWFHLRCAWKQFHAFTGVFGDRFRMQSGDEMDCRSRGWEHVEAVQAWGRGGLLLMSHQGNWELAAQFMRQRQPGLPLMLYMGSREKEQIERLQKQDLAMSGVRVVAVNQGEASPLDGLEGIRHLQAGGLVGMTGDLLWRADQRAVAVEFLGRTAHLPAAPYLFALLAGSPLLVFFTQRTGTRSHLITVHPPIFVRARGREERQAALTQAAQTYARLLEGQVRCSPFEWFHFAPFLEAPGAPCRAHNRSHLDKGPGLN